MRTTTLPVLALLSIAPLLLTGLAACGDPPSADESTSNGTESTSGDGDGESGDESPVIIREPGETKCLDSATLEVCEPTGLDWEQVPCGDKEECDSDFVDPEGNTVAACVGPCERLGDSSSSEGCSFYTTSMYQALQPPPEPEDAIVIGNPSQTDTVSVELRWVPFGSNIEEIYEGPVLIGPGQTYVFHLDPALTIYKADLEKTSLFRSGSVYHVVSDLPVVAYLHAPFEGHNTNGSTLLLPENMLKGDYVVYGHGAWLPPNYFIVIAMENQTTVTWRPTFQTAGDSLPLPFLAAGETGMQLLNRFDNMRIDTSLKDEPPYCQRDLSGTIIEADKPIWVVSAVLAARVPWCGTAGNQGDPTLGCATIMNNANCSRGSDFAMEQNLPLDYWGREYVGPHSPLRGIEQHHWRIYAGDDNITVTVTPPQPGTPIDLAKRGDWADLIVPNGTHLEFDGTGVFMPVQYVTGHYDTVPPNPDIMAGDPLGKGSPAMVQMVPTAQFLDRYVIVTGFNYDEHYVQSIRPAGAADVLLDGVAIPDSDWEAVGEWEIATTLLEEGAHELTSADSFGIVQYGYSLFIDQYFSSSGYAYMGGMKAEVIFIP